MEEIKYKNASRWRLVTIGLAVLCVILFIIVLILAVLYHRELQSKQNEANPPERTQGAAKTLAPRSSDDFPEIPSTIPPSPSNDIDTSEPFEPDVFHPLTKLEMTSLLQYLLSVPELGLAKTSDETPSALSSIDLMLPSKKETLSYLNGTGPKPTRRAKVILIRADKQIPDIEEYEVILSNGSYSLQLLQFPNRRNPVQYSFRFLDYSPVYYLITQVERHIRHVLLESYSASFRNCKSRCLIAIPFAVSSGFTDNFQRRMWVSVFYKVDYFTLFTVDLAFYLDVTNTSNVIIEKIYYHGSFWNDLEALATDYDTGNIQKAKFSFPNVTKESFSTMYRRGPTPTPYGNRRAPKMVEPDGHRYILKHKHVKYMNWEFDFRMSTYNGPILNNVRFSGDRIAFEVGLQEIAAFYTGNAPNIRVAQLVDGLFLLGNTAQNMVQGVDCPDTATMVPVVGTSFKTRNAFCLFELNSGIPLRRHMGSYGSYSGMVDSFLVLRTILVISNYDYIFDFIFHQSGILEVKVASSGYILGGVYNDHEAPYGFQLKDKLLGTIHQHLFHFKVDLDILGTSNRYETLEFKTIDVSNADWLPPGNTDQTQIRFQASLKQSEEEAAYHYNFNTPKEHIFYNSNITDEFGNHRAYKIQLSGMNKQLLPEGMMSESSISWSRYQMAITKYKEEELSSTSIYASFDAKDPVVDFSKFVADDENIVDKDLVAWISMGMYHLPHTEDLPLTQTPGKHLSFMLTPHNYFKEDPSMSSYDQVRQN